MGLDLPYPYPDPATGQWDPFALLRNLQFLAANVDRSVANPAANGPGGAVANLQGTVTAAASTLALTADAVTFRNPDTGATRAAQSSSWTLDLTTTGAGGRDTASSFTSQWVYVYAISTGASSALLATASAPPTEPTLPTGYPYRAFLMALRVGATANTWANTGYVRGASMLYQANPTVLSAGSATVFTAIDLSSYVPPIANLVLTTNLGTVVSTGGGVVNALVDLSLDGSASFFTYAWHMRLAGLDAAGTEGDAGSSVTMPNVTQQVYYRWTVNSGTTPAFYLNMLGYRVPNGDA